MKSPQQQVFDEIFKISLGLGYRTFDYLPAKDEEYPFVFLGEQFDQDIETKTAVYGLVQQTIHIWGDYRNRRQVTDMMNSLKYEIRRLKHTDNFYITCTSLRSQTMIDDSTGQPLLHGIMEVEFRFN